MRDSHCHILPRLDDGSVSVEESLRMARLLSAFGFTEVCTTPHYLQGNYEPTASIVYGSIKYLQVSIDAEGIPLILLPGMEYCLDEFFPDRIDDILPLAGEAAVLAEIPSGGIPEIVYDNVELLIRTGFSPVIAHPERSALLFDAPQRPKRRGTSLSPLHDLFRAKGADAGASAGSVRPSALFWALVDLGCAFQGNLGSFSGAYGEEVGRRADFLRAEGHYACFGSDGHGADSLARVLDGAVSLKEDIVKRKVFSEVEVTGR